MNRSLKVRLIVIVAVVGLCVYGIIGAPTSRQELTNNIKKHIRLGLDLSGGSQLVAQVHVQDAFKADADTLINRLKDQLQTAEIPYTTISRNDPKSIEDAASIEVDVRGIPFNRAEDFRTIVRDQAGPGWLMASVNPTDYRLTMQPAYAAKLKQDTMTQTMNTIERKIDGLGLSEATVQRLGGLGNRDQDEMLIQLPGISDPMRVKQILKTAAVLELEEVLGGPFSSARRGHRQPRRRSPAQFRNHEQRGTTRRAG